MVDPLSVDSFSTLVGTTFTLAEVDEYPLELTKVEPAGAEAFTLLFRGPSDAVLAESTYTFRRDGEESRSIFIVPIGCSEDGSVYEAVFSSQVVS